MFVLRGILNVVCFIELCMCFLLSPIELSSSSCPSEFHPMPVTSCPSIGCYRFQEQPDIFQQNRQEKRAFCSGQAINTYDGTGGLLEFRTLNEFNRVKEILQATRPSAPYLTSLMYSSAGTLQYVNGANVRQAADTVDTSLPVSSANATLQNKCVGIGVVGDSIDLIVVECDTPQAFICDLQLTGEYCSYGHWKSSLDLLHQYFLAILKGVLQSFSLICRDTDIGENP